MARRLLALAACRAAHAGRRALTVARSTGRRDRQGWRSDLPGSATPRHRSALALDRRPAPPSPLVVVGHATRPQLDLTAAQARRLTSGGWTRWRGLRVVRGLPARRAIDAVERDPRTLAVVPLGAVGPTVVAGSGRRRRPRPRPAVTRCDCLVVGDVMLTPWRPDPAAALAPMSRLLRRADLTVGNLESTLSTRGCADPGRRLVRRQPAAARTAARRRVRRAVAGEQPRRRLRRRGPARHRRRRSRAARSCRSAPATTLAAASRPAVVERGGVRFGFVGFNAIGETPQAGPGAPGALRPPDAAADRTAGAGRPRPRAARRTPDSPAGRRRRGAAALGHAVHPPARAGPAPGRSRRWSGPAPTWSSAATRTGCRAWTRSATCRCCTRSATSSSTWTSWSRRWRASSWRRRSGARSCRAVRLLPYRMDTGTLRASPGRAAPRPRGILDDVWSTSTGPFAASVSARDGSAPASQATTVRAARPAGPGRPRPARRPREW